MGIAASSKVDEQFFSAYLAANHLEVQGRARAEFAKYVASKPVPLALSADGVANVTLSLLGDSPKKDQNYSISIATDRDAYVYCYLQDENDKIARVFPNRFVSSALVKAGGAMQLPGQQPFGLVANSKGVLETFACFAAPADVTPNLGPAVWGVDLEPLPVAGFDAIGEAFAKAGQGKVGLGVLDVKVK